MIMLKLIVSTCKEVFQNVVFTFILTMVMCEKRMLWMLLTDYHCLHNSWIVVLMYILRSTCKDL